MSIAVRNVAKKFGDFVALDDVSLEVPTGELIALLGPSGCGKTSLLRIIAGLEVADRGEIRFHDRDATADGARERRVGFVFQHYALFRHMSVFENVAFGLRVKPRPERLPEWKIREKVHDLLKLVQLDWLADRFPSQLSGGQRQRIALARALAVEPHVLLLDEPFGALDAQVRKELRRWLRRLHDELHVTSVFVTHDQEEALEVADRVVVMNRGRVEQVGTPDEVYSHPATPFVTEFLGSVNLFHSRAHAPWTGENAADSVAYIRPHEFELSRAPLRGEDVPVTVEAVRIIGPRVRVELRHPHQSELIEVELTRERFDADPFTAGEHIHIRPRQLRVFTGRAVARSGDADAVQGK